MFTSSYNEDFKWPEATGWGVKKWPKDRNFEVGDTKGIDPVYRNNETLTQLSRDCLTPFDFLLQPKPIVRTDPRQPLIKPDLPQDDGRARLTRPRVYKCPEISLDDINDPEIREKVIDFTYSTTWGVASKDTCGVMKRQNIPNSVLELPDHVQLNTKGEENKICERVCGKVMNDNHHTQAVGDSTSELAQKNMAAQNISNEAVTNQLLPEFTEKILNLADQNRLRLPYDLKTPGYTGSMPESPMKIQPQKKELQFSDPMVTTYQIANR